MLIDCKSVAGNSFRLDLPGDTLLCELQSKIADSLSDQSASENRVLTPSVQLVIGDCVYPNEVIGEHQPLCKLLTVENVTANKIELNYILYNFTDEQRDFLKSSARRVSNDPIKDRLVMLAAVQKEDQFNVALDDMSLHYASAELRMDKDVVLTAVKTDGRALKFASAELRADREVVLTAISNRSLALKFASEALRANKDVVLNAVGKDGRILRHASEDLKNDRTVVLTAIHQDAIALYHASSDLRADKEVVLAAVSQNGRALEYASEDLKNDRTVVLTAIH